MNLKSLVNRINIFKIKFPYHLLFGSLNPRVYFIIQFLKELSVFLTNLKSDNPSSKTTEDSKTIYQEYGDYEQRAYHSEYQRIAYVDGKLRKVSFKYFKNRMLQYVYKEIDEIIEKNRGRQINILEVGCGNCINLVNLKQRYNEKVSLTGIDISEQRLKVSKKFYGSELDDIKLSEYSIVEDSKFKDSEFDIVFSMHCLEQISYTCEDALREMCRLFSEKLIMIEPVYESGNPTQRLYLINQDHNRILLKTIKQLELSINRFEDLPVYGNPKNPASVIVINKPRSDLKLR